MQILKRIQDALSDSSLSENNYAASCYTVTNGVVTIRDDNTKEDVASFYSAFCSNEIFCYITEPKTHRVVSKKELKHLVLSIVSGYCEPINYNAAKTTEEPTASSYLKRSSDMIKALQFTINVLSGEGYRIKVDRFKRTTIISTDTRDTTDNLFLISIDKMNNIIVNDYEGNITYCDDIPNVQKLISDYVVANVKKKCS